MNSYQQHTAPSQQTQAQYPLRPPSSQQHISFQQTINPQMNMNPSSQLQMNTTLHSSVNPAYLAGFQNPQHPSMNGMIPKFPSVYPSYQQHPQQSLNQSHPQIPTIASSQLHSQPQQPPSQSQNQSSISPTQLLSASPSQLIAGHASQQMPPQQLTLTPAQLLQQQQTVSTNPSAIASTPGMNLGGVNPNMASLGGMSGLGMNMGGMNNMQPVQNVSNMGNMGSVNNMGIPTTMGLQSISHMASAPSQAQNPAMRMAFPPGMNPMRYAQMTPQERVVFQQQQQAANLGHVMPTSRPAAPGTPSQPAPHERGPSLTHERPPSQHGRAMSDRQPSQQPHDRAQSQPHDLSALQGDRPSSSASVRSHHSHPPHDGTTQHGIMPPPGSRPGTATGTMAQTPSRMNPAQHPMNLNPNMNASQLTPGMGPSNMGMNMNMTMASHMAPGPNLNHTMNQAQQMNAAAVAANLNLQMNLGAGMPMGPVGGGGMGMQMNRPPTRTGSALGLGSPKQSPRMSMGPMGGAPGVSVSPSVGMGGMGAGVQANVPSNMGGGMGPMSGGNMGSMGGPMNGNIGMGIGPQGMSTMSGMSGMGGMGPMSMNPSAQGLSAGGNMMGSVGGGMMGPPVVPQTMQRPGQDQMMQPHMRDQPAPGPRETSLPPTSAGAFIGLDGANVSSISPSTPGLQRQGSQPPPQQSPVRQLQPPHHSPMPPMRKPGEIPGPAGTPPVNVPPVSGSTPVQKLPPHLASLNPAVTKISYIPYVVPKTESTEDTRDEDKKPSDESDTDKDTSKDKDKEDAVDGDVEPKPGVKIEDPVPRLSLTDITTLKSIMARDSAYETVYRAKQGRMMQEMRSSGPGAKLAWWDRDYAAANGVMGGAMGMGRRPERFDVRYPRPARNEQMGMRRKGARREGIRIPSKLPNELANRPEQLVPIRLEFDVEHHRMRETFVWNLNDPVITPEMFAQTLVEDYALAPNYHSVITKSIQEQLSDFKAHVASIDTDWKAPIEISQSEGVAGDDPEDSDIEVVRQSQHQPSVFEVTGMATDEMKEGNGSANSGKNEDGNVDSDVECEDPVVGRGTLDEEAIQWWESWRKRAKKEMPTRSAMASGRRKKRKISTRTEDEHRGVGDTQERPRAVDEIEVDEKEVREDLRILIKLDIIVGSMKLDDQFEWDLENQDASPEQFAEVYAKELGLGGEFKTAIVHCIREQVQVYQKSLFLVGHPADGSSVQDDDLRMSFLPSLASAARAMDQVQSFTPTLNYLSDGEIERNEKEREKELTKRRKRNTRGRRGIALPDREPNRTYRTPAVGFPELDAATLALAAAANAPTSRRAAAAAASLTIANMVASENGTTIMPLQLPPQQTTSQVTLALNKEKKAKGLFKPPDYPSSILRPRAKVSAPTPSTAVASVSMLPSSLLENDPPAPSVVSVPPPDSKALAKKARENEREAKEKEFADGQHANLINGVWHCSNCGCPESIAIGRRKGPLGDKSQCGTCGKFWHRHRRPRPVQYNSDPQYHLNLKNEELGKTAAAKKRGRAANSVAVDGTETPSRQKSELWVEVPTRPPNSSTIPPSEDDRPVSPVSTASSASEAPLAQQVLKTNGTNAARASTPESPRPQPNVSSSSPGVGEPAPHSNGSFSIPTWLSAAIVGLQTKYPDDKFEAILRKPSPKAPPEWRIKCLDCPGKLYNPGPGDSLSNYEVHLKNRQHRIKVTARVKGGSS